MSKISSHKDLKVWRISMELVTTIYQITEKFPESERFGLVNQMRRAAISIPSNIAEGAGRKGEKEWIRFLYISLGSLAELETQLEISFRLGHTKENLEVSQQIKYIRNMLTNLIKSLKSS